MTLHESVKFPGLSVSFYMGIVKYIFNNYKKKVSTEEPRAGGGFLEASDTPFI
jgi:hypothetical protein